MKCGWQKAKVPSGSSKTRSAGFAQRAQDAGCHAAVGGCFFRITSVSSAEDKRRAANGVMWSGHSANRPAGVATVSTRSASQIAHFGLPLRDSIEISAIDHRIETARKAVKISGFQAPSHVLS